MLVLPDRRDLLDALDRVPAHGERVGAMRRRRRDDDAGVADLEAPRAVMDREPHVWPSRGRLVRDRNQGRTVSFLEYEAYEPLAVKALARIVDEAREAWPSARLAVHHRIGRLELGEASIIIVAASPHRAAAFAACRYTIERVKQIVPIWKHEHFEGGDVWLEGATADPTDEQARQEAYRIACA